jgi:predicted nucleotidyltransferase
MISEKKIKEAAKRIAEHFHPREIILFGSYARGTADSKSDVDLLVISSFKKKRRQLMIEIDKVLWGLVLARDIVVLTPEEFDTEKEIPGTIARYASREGKVLYEQG